VTLKIFGNFEGLQKDFAAYIELKHATCARYFEGLEILLRKSSFQ